MYQAVVRSHLDYCDNIYRIPAYSQTNLGMTLNSSMEKVERTQYQAALAIFCSRIPYRREYVWRFSDFPISPIIPQSPRLFEGTR